MITEDKQIVVNKANYNSLKKAYDKAIKENKIEFTYSNNVLLVNYAKYLLEYMKGVVGG